MMRLSARWLSVSSASAACTSVVATLTSSTAATTRFSTVAKSLIRLNLAKPGIDKGEAIYQFARVGAHGVVREKRVARSHLLSDKPEKLRWPRSHKFTLSDVGRSAALAYREQTQTSRNGGRASYDAARAEWATSHRLQVDDGLYLDELTTGGATLPQLLTALETCGQTRREALAALSRLADAGMFAE